MNKEKWLNEFLIWIENKKPLVIDYGDGIKDEATWDESLKKYRDSTGIWPTELLIQIAKGEIKNTKIEIGE